MGMREPHHPELHPGTRRTDRVSANVLVVDLVGAEISDHPGHTPGKRKARREVRVQAAAERYARTARRHIVGSAVDDERLTHRAASQPSLDKRNRTVRPG